MLINPTHTHARARASGASLVELIVTLAITLVVGTAFSSFLYSASVNLGNMFTYADMDSANQKAINMMTREIRLARRVISASSGNLTIENTNGVAVTYAYRSSDRSLVRTASGSTSQLLRNCDAATFTLCKGARSNAFEVFPAATNVAEAKIVDFSWRCSKQMTGGLVASDSLASAKIILRNQGK